MANRIEDYLQKLEVQLLSDEHRKLLRLTKEWFESLPVSSGVYLLREEGIICYVEEAKNLRKRIYDLIDSRKHTLRRKVGQAKFSSKSSFTKATSIRKFSSELEKELNFIFEDNFEISFIEVPIGRKELEERILEKYSPLYNSIDKSMKNEKAYSIDRIREQYEKAYQPWTPEDDLELKRLYQEGVSIHELAETFSRNKGSIRSRLKKITEK
jgi:hypothetical protein